MGVHSVGIKNSATVVGEFLKQYSAYTRDTDSKLAAFGYEQKTKINADHIRLFREIKPRTNLLWESMLNNLGENNDVVANTSKT